MLEPGDHLLLGTDLVKEPSRLEAAYDDSQGVTAEFNKNVLAVLNRELGAEFDLDGFEHLARYDPDAAWMDIRLRSLTDQSVRIDALDLTVRFKAGEEMRTEISAKFTRERLEAIYLESGLELAGWFTDPAGDYALSLARPARMESAI
jgi:L-histidine N-alpha-methyltransferase